MDQFYLHLSEKMDEHHEVSQEAFKEIRAEIKEIRKCQETDISQLKVDSESCKHRWSILGRLASFGGLGTVIATLLAKVFGIHL